MTRNRSGKVAIFFIVVLLRREGLPEIFIGLSSWHPPLLWLSSPKATKMIRSLRIAPAYEGLVPTFAVLPDPGRPIWCLLFLPSWTIVASVLHCSCVWSELLMMFKRAVNFTPRVRSNVRALRSCEYLPERLARNAEAATSDNRARGIHGRGDATRVAVQVGGLSGSAFGGACAARYSSIPSSILRGNVGAGPTSCSR